MSEIHRRSLSIPGTPYSNVGPLRSIDSANFLRKANSPTSIRDTITPAPYKETIVISTDGQEKSFIIEESSKGKKELKSDDLILRYGGRGINSDGIEQEYYFEMTTDSEKMTKNKQERPLARMTKGVGAFGKAQVIRFLDQERNALSKQFVIKTVKLNPRKIQRENEKVNKEFEIMSLAGDHNIGLPVFFSHEKTNAIDTKIRICSELGFKKEISLEDMTVLAEKLHRFQTDKKLGYWHRDLKPDNVLFKRGENDHFEPVLIDFGLSKKVGSALKFIGTPYYLEPNLYSAKNKDIYAFGMMMLETILKKLPAKVNLTNSNFNHLTLTDLMKIKFSDIKQRSMESLWQEVVAAQDKDPKARTDTQLDQALDCLTKMICNPTLESRFSSFEQMLEHPGYEHLGKVEEAIEALTKVKVNLESLYLLFRKDGVSHEETIKELSNQLGDVDQSIKVKILEENKDLFSGLNKQLLEKTESDLEKIYIEIRNQHEGDFSDDQIRYALQSKVSIPSEMNRLLNEDPAVLERFRNNYQRDQDLKLQMQKEAAEITELLESLKKELPDENLEDWCETVENQKQLAGNVLKLKITSKIVKHLQSNGLDRKTNEKIADRFIQDKDELFKVKFTKWDLTSNPFAAKRIELDDLPFI